MQFIDPPEWLPLLPTPGEFKHPSYGQISISKERNARFLENLQSGIYQTRIPIDAEHQLKVSGAVGWIVDGRQNEDGSIDGKAEWTERGTTMLVDNRFAYVSPEWFDKWTAPDTGTEYEDVLVGLGLCTRPFFKESALRSLVASERGLEIAKVQKDGDSESYILIFTAATPITPEVKPMADKPDEKKAAEVTPPDEKKAVEPDQTMRFAEMESQIKTLTETLGKKDEALKQATDRVTAVERDLREKRFSDVVKDFSGPAEGHISMLEFIADHEEKGEESDRFKKYSEDQRALAEQLKTANLFNEIGSDAPGSTKTAADELNALAKKYQEDHAADKLTFAQAYDVVMGQNPALYNKHVEETRKGVN